jgi:hypothetical protein
VRVLLRVWFPMVTIKHGRRLSSRQNQYLVVTRYPDDVFVQLDTRPGVSGTDSYPSLSMIGFFTPVTKSCKGCRLRDTRHQEAHREGGRWRLANRAVAMDGVDAVRRGVSAMRLHSAFLRNRSRPGGMIDRLMVDQVLKPSSIRRGSPVKVEWWSRR